MDSYVVSLSLMFIPLLFAILFIAKENLPYRKALSYIFILILVSLAVMLVSNGPVTVKIPEAAASFANTAVIVLEAGIIGFLYYVTIKHKRWGTLMLVVVQTVLYFVSQFTAVRAPESNFYIDKLSLAMVLIVNVIGSLIVLFANDYIVHYEETRKMKSRKKTFYFVVCLFLAAMNGLILSDSLDWVYFFWEVTTLTSFILISYNNDKEAYNSGFRALFLNLIGGLCFSVGILIFRNMYGIETITGLIKHGALAGLFALPVVLLSVAGFTKSAQMPFQSWLLGAMVAPTPVSALLHSSTMVNAGVYLIIKLSPSYAGTWVGTTIAIYGAFTFLVCSILGVTQRNGKRVLAYSTIANLGLIVSSAGIGTPTALSAAIMLLIFHAISKGLLFLCAGQIEHIIGSRDIEEMTGLVRKAPLVTIIAAIGMSSMLLPPFGVLITKWISIEASAHNPVVALLIIIGSAFMSMLWIKWLGTILASPVNDLKPKIKLSASTLIPLLTLTTLIVVATFFITQIFNYFVNPEITSLLHKANTMTVNSGNVKLSTGSFNDLFVFYVMIASAVIYFIAQKLIFTNVKIKKVYMCGENNSDKNTYFRDGVGQYEKSNVSNMYLTAFLSEDKITKAACLVSIGILIFSLVGGWIL